MFFTEDLHMINPQREYMINARKNSFGKWLFPQATNYLQRVQGAGGGKKGNVVQPHPYSRVLVSLGRTPRLLLQSA